MAHSNDEFAPASSVETLRKRVARTRKRRSSNRPPPITLPEPAPSNDSESTGPFAALMNDDTRAQLDSLVQLQVHLSPAGESNLYIGLSQDVACGGVFVATHAHLDLAAELGRRVAVTMTFPGGLETRALGLVRFARDVDEATGVAPGLGIKFVALTLEGHQLIRQFAEHREPLFFSD